MQLCKDCKHWCGGSSNSCTFRNPGVSVVDKLISIDQHHLPPEAIRAIGLKPLRVVDEVEIADQELALFYSERAHGVCVADSRGKYLRGKPSELNYDGCCKLYVPTFSKAMRQLLSITLSFLRGGADESHCKDLG